MTFFVLPTYLTIPISRTFTLYHTLKVSDKTKVTQINRKNAKIEVKIESISLEKQKKIASSMLIHRCNALVVMSILGQFNNWNIYNRSRQSRWLETRDQFLIPTTQPHVWYWNELLRFCRFHSNRLFCQFQLQSKNQKLYTFIQKFALAFIFCTQNTPIAQQTFLSFLSKFFQVFIESITVAKPC